MGKRKLAQSLEGEVNEKDATMKASEGGASDEEIAVEVKVIGELVKKSGGKGKVDKKCYHAFEVDGNRYDIDDAVLIKPENPQTQKPYVAIIKEIKQGIKHGKEGPVQVRGQWFYRPEEAEKKGGGTWASPDSRELFYSFHIDDVPAESVMHKCIAHFIPPHKQLPQRSKNPGFIVRRVYDACEKKLFNLTDKDYEDPMQKEIDRLVEKTRDALGDIPDVDGDETMALPDEEASPDIKIKRRITSRRNMMPLNVKSDESNGGELRSQGDTPTTTGKADPPKAETPTSCVGTDAEASSLLRTHGVLLGVHARDRWLEKLIQTIRDLCGGGKGFSLKNEETDLNNALSKVRNGGEAEGGKQGSGRIKTSLGEGRLAWPEVAPAAVQVVSSLERLSYDSLGSDLHKYNLKMRQLDFNVKNNKVLARRLLSKELEPVKVINMSPSELKDGYIAAEKSDQEPSEQETIQMADVRCSICTEREVGVIDIIHVGFGDRYQLECLKCGNTWYSSRDAISSLVIKTKEAPSVGIAPWATSKFEEVEKDLTTPAAAQSVQPIDSTNVITVAIDSKSPPATPSACHYEEVENTLKEKLPVTNPVAKDFVNVNAETAPFVSPTNAGADSRNSKHVSPQLIHTPITEASSKPEISIPHSDLLNPKNVLMGSGAPITLSACQNLGVGTNQSSSKLGESNASKQVSVDVKPSGSSDEIVPPST